MTVWQCHIFATKKPMVIAVILLMPTCLHASLATKDGKTNFGDKILLYQGSFPLGSVPYYFLLLPTMSFIQQQKYNFYVKINSI
jgi:hypothetical protein